VTHLVAACMVHGRAVSSPGRYQMVISRMIRNGYVKNETDGLLGLPLGGTLRDG